MTDLVAKQIIKNQYWVITDGNKKVGNVVADNNGYDVRLNGNDLHFTSTEDIKNQTKITFQTVEGKSKNVLPYPEYPFPDKIFNSMMDVVRKLHLFTIDKKSKCYHVAGWFIIDINGNKKVIFCPKYIYIQRYNWNGPYKTEKEAMETAQ